MPRGRKYPQELIDRGVGLAIESGRPDLPSSQEREEIKKLRQEVFELRRANEILKAASVFFAAELDQDRTK